MSEQVAKKHIASFRDRVFTWRDTYLAPYDILLHHLN